MIWFSTATERDTNNWLDRECLTRKRDARRALTRFKRTKSDVDKQIYRQKRAEYKSTVKEKKQQYKTSVHQPLTTNEIALNFVILSEEHDKGKPNNQT